VPLQFLSPLHKANRQLSLYLEGRLDDLGTSPQEGHLLTYLHRYAPATVGELVRVFGLIQCGAAKYVEAVTLRGVENFSGLTRVQGA